MWGRRRRPPPSLAMGGNLCEVSTAEEEGARSGNAPATRAAAAFSWRWSRRRRGRHLGRHLHCRCCLRVRNRPPWRKMPQRRSCYPPPPLCRSQRQQCGGSLRENAEPCCRQQGRVPQRKTLCIVDAGGRGCRCREGAAVLHAFSKICASRRCGTLFRQRPSEGWSAIFLISRCCHRPFSRKCCVAEATFLLPVPSLQQRF